MPIAAAAPDPAPNQPWTSTTAGPYRSGLHVCHDPEDAQRLRTSGATVDGRGGEGGLVHSGAAAGSVGALVVLLVVVIRIIIAADRVDRSRARTEDARARAALQRARTATPARERPEPPRGVGYRGPRPPINSPEALARFRATTPPGVTVSPPPRITPDDRFKMTVTSLADNERAFAEGRISRVDHDVTAARLTKRIGQLDRTRMTAQDGPQKPVSAEILKAAAELVITTQYGSTTMVQRKLSVTPAQAIAIMDHLEHCGIVGPANGGVARQVLVPLTELGAALNMIRQLPGS